MFDFELPPGPLPSFNLFPNKQITSGINIFPLSSGELGITAWGDGSPITSEGEEKEDLDPVVVEDNEGLSDFMLVSDAEGIDEEDPTLIDDEGE